MLFKCKVCIEKDSRIADLKAQIQDLRQFAIPSNSAEPSIQELEADGALSGQQHIIEIPDTSADDEELMQILSERDRLMGGTF